jgi:hypothetical protein
MRFVFALLATSLLACASVCATAASAQAWVNCLPPRTDFHRAAPPMGLTMIQPF